jgi:hypothetical protein
MKLYAIVNYEEPKDILVSGGGEAEMLIFGSKTAADAWLAESVDYNEIWCSCTVARVTPEMLSRIDCE